MWNAPRNRTCSGCPYLKFSYSLWKGDYAVGSNVELNPILIKKAAKTFYLCSLFNAFDNYLWVEWLWIPIYPTICLFIYLRSSVWQVRWSQKQAKQEQQLAIFLFTTKQQTNVTESYVLKRYTFSEIRQEVQSVTDVAKNYFTNRHSRGQLRPPSCFLPTATDAQLTETVTPANEDAGATQLL